MDTSPQSQTQHQTTINSLVTRSEPNNNPYPTTFVQADTSSFKQVVQMLTGRSEPARAQNPIPPKKTGGLRNDMPSPKLFERRNNTLKSFKISPLAPGPVAHRTGCFGSPRPGTPEVLSPSVLNFPALTLSPVTPLDLEAEAKAIREKGFYLHPSPGNTPKDVEPRLLPLFPVTSPSSSGNC